jgi:hypothetical protein
VTEYTRPINGPLPSPLPRERLDQRALWLRLRAGQERTAVGGDDALAAAALPSSHVPAKSLFRATEKEGQLTISAVCPICTAAPWP